jgi:putative copper export protein
VTEGSTLFWESLTKAALYLALQCAAGAASAYWLARGSAVVQAGAPSAIERRLSRAALWASAVLLCATLARALAHTTAAFGQIDVDSLRTIALESRWGHAWRIQVAVAALAFAAAAVPARRIAWPLYSAAMLAFCCSVPLVGHGAGATGRTALHALHIAAGAIWIGTLMMLAMLVAAQEASGRASVHQMVAAFSAVALPSAAILLATGAIASALYVQQLAHLWDSVYGRVLVAKLSLVAVVAACGRRNWQRSRRGAPASLRVMTIELAAAVLVVLVTGVLTELEHP